IKYGALSVPGGRLEISASALARHEVVLTWRERGGPPVSPPSRTGFGSRLISRLAAQLNGSLELDWQPAGLVATLSWTC
ncbi:MAG TPA: sensor histidine kinase, partial [Phenylobacterium sp.]|nr:sensor histidine kinase [Phenylobacterium sp.]